MNVLQIKIHEDGTLECSPDFKIIRGSYRDILMNVEVPHSLLLAPVMDESNNNVTGNNVRVGAIIHTSTGKNLQTQKYELEWVKDYERDGVQYRLYQRIMPKEFTLWEAVNSMENATESGLNLVFNVVNWTLNGNQAKTERVVASPVLKLNVYASTYLDNEDQIDNPSDFDILQSQVQEMAVSIEDTKTDLSNVDAYAKQVNEKVENVKNELGMIDDALGSYLQQRIVEGKNIKIEHNTNDMTINVDNLTAEDVTFKSTVNVVASNVQDAIEVLADKVGTGGSGGGSNEIVLFKGPLKEEDAYYEYLSQDERYKTMYTFIPFNCKLQKNDIIRIYFSFKNFDGHIQEGIIEYKVINAENYYITKEMAARDNIALKEDIVVSGYNLAAFGFSDIIPEPEHNESEFVLKNVEFAYNNTLNKVNKLMLGGGVNIMYNFDKLAEMEVEVAGEGMWGNGLHVFLGLTNVDSSSKPWWNYEGENKATQILKVKKRSDNGNTGRFIYGYVPVYDTTGNMESSSNDFYEPVVFNKVTCIKSGGVL